MIVTESVVIALIVFFAGALISYMVAGLIKGIFWGIRFRGSMKIRGREKWRNATVATKS